MDKKKNRGEEPRQVTVPFRGGGKSFLQGRIKLTSDNDFALLLTQQEADVYCFREGDRYSGARVVIVETPPTEAERFKVHAVD